MTSHALLDRIVDTLAEAIPSVLNGIASESSVR
jgi:hypothetical protein